jgi:hypothetical protein
MLRKVSVPLPTSLPLCRCSSCDTVLSDRFHVRLVGQTLKQRSVLSSGGVSVMSREGTQKAHQVLVRIRWQDRTMCVRRACVGTSVSTSKETSDPKSRREQGCYFIYSEVTPPLACATLLCTVYRQVRYSSRIGGVMIMMLPGPLAPHYYMVWRWCWSLIPVETLWKQTATE